MAESEPSDCNALVADCIVITCCCEFLVLQIAVFVFLGLPSKVARKTREYARKKMRKRRKVLESSVAMEDSDGDGVFGSMEVVQLKNELNRCRTRGGLAMEEVEKVLEELSLKGEFAFGSFWGRDFTGPPSSMGENGLFVGHSFVHCHLVEVVKGPFS